MKNKKRKTRTVNIAPAFLLAFLLIISLSLAQQISSATYHLKRTVVDSGGVNSSSPNYFAELSTEPIGGNASSANYAACIGYNCCPADVIARFVNSTINESASTATIVYSIWHADLCMGTTNVTIQCAVNCDPCTQSCSSVSITRNTLTLTDAVTDRNIIGSVADPNISSPIYCRITGDTFPFETCFNSPTNLTVTIEAGGPYTGISATVLIAGNTTYSDGTVVEGVNVTISLYRTSDLAVSIGTVTLNSSKDGKYFANFYNLALDNYRVNVTARHGSLRANATDTFGVISIHGSCTVRTIALSGRALDATTGLRITSGAATLTVVETGDRIDTSISNGEWSATLTTCIISGQRYNVVVRITDNAGKVSWSDLQFTAP